MKFAVCQCTSLNGWNDVNRHHSNHCNDWFDFWYTFGICTYFDFISIHFFDNFLCNSKFGVSCVNIESQNLVKISFTNFDKM